MYGYYLRAVIRTTIIFMVCTISASAQLKTCIVKEYPPEAYLILSRKTLEILCVNYKKAIRYDEYGYPHLDFSVFNRDDPELTVQSYNALILENLYMRLTLLPGKGKPFSFIYKVTGHEEFFVPPVARVLGSPNRLGWWLVLGGVEYTLPDKEHGDTWAGDWKWKISDNSDTIKTVCMQVKERRFGLEEKIAVSLYPDKAYYEANISIYNPTSDTVSFQHWINPMWAPGGRGEITPNTEFIIPTEKVIVTERKFNQWMLDYHPERKRKQLYSDNPLRWLKGWKSIGDLLAGKLKHGFYSAFSHDENEGIVRVFPEDIHPGCNIWSWGFDPPPETRKRFSGTDTCRGYVEMWGGITRGFDEYYTLNPGDSLSWTEWMYPFHQTKGLHYANRDFTVTFTRLPNEKSVFRLCPSGVLTDTEVVIVNPDENSTLLHIQYESFFPSENIPSFIIDKTPADAVCIIYQNGTEIVRLHPRMPDQ